MVAQSRREYLNRVPRIAEQWRSNDKKSPVISWKPRYSRGMTNSMPGGTSVMLLSLIRNKCSRDPMAPCCISRRFKLGRSVRERTFSLGNHSVRNVSYSPLYALVNCRHVRFDNRERDGRGSSLSCDQYRDNSYKFCSPTAW